MEWAERVRLGVRTLGELLITFGVVLFLFCAYQLFYTNYVAHQAAASEMDALHKQWLNPAPQAAGSKTAAQPRAVDTFSTADSAGNEGEAFAIIHIPRLGVAFESPILEGTDLDTLARGVGHYHGTAMPGQIGNFALAGHRKTHGEPFRHLDEMREGDLIVVETADAWYTYREDKDPFIIDPTDLAIVAPVPDHPGQTPSGRLITLTTCNPWWASYQRMIVEGHLVWQQPRAAGPPPALHANLGKFD
jgi:sortase A